MLFNDDDFDYTEREFMIKMGEAAEMHWQGNVAVRRRNPLLTKKSKLDAPAPVYQFHDPMEPLWEYAAIPGEHVGIQAHCFNKRRPQSYLVF